MVVSTSDELKLNLDNTPVDENNSIKILEITKNLQDHLNKITTLASESNTLYTHQWRAQEFGMGGGCHKQKCIIFNVYYYKK